MAGARLYIESAGTAFYGVNDTSRLKAVHILANRAGKGVQQVNEWILQSGLSKALGQSGLLQDGVGCMPRFDVVIYGKSDTRDWAFPNLVIASASPNEIAASLLQEFLQLRSEAIHAASAAPILILLEKVAITSTGTS